jgi:hypothetical protein
MQAELRKLYSDYGQMFSDWWHEKTTQQRKDTLLHVTHNTIPLKKPTEADIRRGTKNSRCLEEYNIDDLIGTCGCTCGGEHVYADSVLHEVFIRAMHPETADSLDNAICQKLLQKGVLPDMFQSLAFVKPQDDGPEKYDLEIMQVTRAAPQAEIENARTASRRVPCERRTKQHTFFIDEYTHWGCL